MLETIFRWLGLSVTKPTQPEGLKQLNIVRQLNIVAPLKNSPDEAPSAKTRMTSSFVCREAVIDRNENIAGYEFALGRKLQTGMLEQSAKIRRVYDDAMLHNLAPLGVSTLFGTRLSFIRLSADSLKSPLLGSLSQLNTVIMITPGVLAEADLVGLRDGLKKLSELGFKYGWTIDRPRPDIVEFLHEAAFIEIETAALDGIQLKMMVREYRSLQNRPKLIACGLKSSDEFNLCYHCGFDYFMGSFASNRENWHPAKSEINRLVVIEVLNMIRSGAEFEVIADRLRTEPILTFKLLRYVNSPGIGLLQKIDDIGHALVYLGRDLFYRWLSLLLFDFNQAGYRERILNEQALTRARFMQMLAGKGGVPDVADQLFITGLFSLLDVMMDRPIIELIKQISLPDAVASALKGEQGAIRDAMLLGIAVESNVQEEMAAMAELCGLDAREVASLMIEALTWAQQVIYSGK